MHVNTSWSDGDYGDRLNSEGIGGDGWRGCYSYRIVKGSLGNNIRILKGIKS